MHCRQLGRGLPLCVWGSVCSLCGGMTDRGKQILWGARVNASPPLSLAAHVGTYSHLLLPEEVKQRRSVEENGRHGRREMEEVGSSVPFLISLV